jgi:hypothetical protein
MHLGKVNADQRARADKYRYTVVQCKSGARTEGIYVFLQSQKRWKLIPYQQNRYAVHESRFRLRSVGRKWPQTDHPANVAHNKNNGLAF